MFHKQQQKSSERVDLLLIGSRTVYTHRHTRRDKVIREGLLSKGFYLGRDAERTAVGRQYKMFILGLADNIEVQEGQESTFCRGHKGLDDGPRSTQQKQRAAQLPCQHYSNTGLGEERYPSVSVCVEKCVIVEI